MVVTFIVRMEFAQADRKQMEDHLVKLAEATRKEPGCVTFIPHFVRGGAPTVLLYEQYIDESALALHRSTPHFMQYVAEGVRKLMTSRQVEDLEAVA